MMYRISKRERDFLYIAVIFVSLAIFSRAVLSPALGKSAGLGRQIQLKKRMIENSLYLLNQKEDIQKESQKYTNYARQKFSEEEETASFLKEIEDIARKSQLQLIDLKPYSAERKDFYPVRSKTPPASADAPLTGRTSNGVYIEYRIEIETESDMNQLITFIYNLQHSESLLRVVKFRISPKADKLDILKTYLTITKVLIP